MVDRSRGVTIANAFKAINLQKNKFSAEWKIINSAKEPTEINKRTNTLVIALNSWKAETQKELAKAARHEGFIFNEFATQTNIVEFRELNVNGCFKAVKEFHAK
jgi:hypothetical protein